MAYGKFIARLLFSENSDYSSPSQDTGYRELTSTPVDSQLYEIEIPTGLVPKTILAATEWASCDCLYVENLEASGGNPVTVSYTDAAATAQAVVVLAGGSFHTTDVDPSSVAVTVLSTVAACRCLIGIIGTA